MNSSQRFSLGGRCFSSDIKSPLKSWALAPEDTPIRSPNDLREMGSFYFEYETLRARPRGTKTLKINSRRPANLHRSQPILHPSLPQNPMNVVLNSLLRQIQLFRNFFVGKTPRKQRQQ